MLKHMEMHYIEHTYFVQDFSDLPLSIILTLSGVQEFNYMYLYKTILFPFQKYHFLITKPYKKQQQDFTLSD